MRIRAFNGLLILSAGLVCLALTFPFPITDKTPLFAEVSPKPVAPAVLPPLRSGEALIAAAYGFEALQPESYDRDIVIELIEASPLDAPVKAGLAEELSAAEMGYLSLDAVLSDVRIALSVE